MKFGAREFIFIVLLLAMPVATWWFVFKPRNHQIRQAKIEIYRKQTKLKQLETATKRLDDLGREIDKLVDAVKLFEEKLPAQREVEVILKQVWELAGKQNLTPKSVRTDKPIMSQQFAELPIKMQIIGDFDSFYSFMLELEKLSRITRVPKMKLVKTKDDDGQMRAELVLSIFFELKQPEPTTSTASAR